MVNEIVLIVFQVAILIMSVVIHEVAHGVAAYRMGDMTAKYAGRLTLNPLRHLDWMGSFLVPLIMINLFGIGFGWAKPVPYNPYNLRDQKNGPALVGLAGPLSNIILALIFGLVARLISLTTPVKSDIVFGFLRGDYENLSVAISGSFSSIFFLLVIMVVIINVFLSLFNLIPIPPLDGSKLLFAILPLKEETKAMLESFGFIFLFIFIFLFSGVLSFIINFGLGLFLRYIVGI